MLVQTYLHPCPGSCPRKSSLLRADNRDAKFLPNTTNITAPMSIGVSLSQLISESPQPLLTGIPELDKALNHGLQARSIYEVYGPPGIGKTRFGLQLTESTAEHAKVLWIETFKPMPSTGQLGGSRELHKVRVTNFSQLFFLISALRDTYQLILVDGMSQLVCDHLYTLQKRSKPNVWNLHDLKCKHLIQLFTAMTKYIHQHGTTLVLLNDCMNTAFCSELDQETFDVVDDHTNFYVTSAPKRRSIQILKSSLLASTVAMGKKDARWEVFLKNRIGMFWDWQMQTPPQALPCRVLLVDSRKRGRDDQGHKIHAAFDARARLRPLGPHSLHCAETQESELVYDSQGSAD